MLKDLTEDVTLNISSFLLRPKEELRLHNNKKFREIQRKNKINIDIKEIQRRLRNVYRPIKLGEPDTYTENYDNVIAKIEELKYSYTITCNNCRYKKKD